MDKRKMTTVKKFKILLLVLILSTVRSYAANGSVSYQHFEVTGIDVCNLSNPNSFWARTIFSFNTPISQDIQIGDLSYIKQGDICNVEAGISGASGTYSYSFTMIFPSWRQKDQDNSTQSHREIWLGFLSFLVDHENSHKRNQSRYADLNIETWKKDLQNLKAITKTSNNETTDKNNLNRLIKSQLIAKLDSISRDVYSNDSTHSSGATHGSPCNY